MSDEPRGMLLTKITYVLVGLAAVALCLTWVSAGGLVPGGALPVFIVTAVVVILAGAITGHIAILRRTGEAGDRIFFETVFPTLMAIMPVAGFFLAGWGAIKLFRGKLGECTIRSGSSSSHYPASDIGRAGVPVGLILLLLALNQPIVALLIVREVKVAAVAEASDPVRQMARTVEEGCKGLVDCFSQAGFVGQVAGRAKMKVLPTGGVAAVELELPGASEEIVACVRATAEAKRLTAFVGPPGLLTCEWAGSVSGQAQSVNVTGRFEPAAEHE